MGARKHVPGCRRGGGAAVAGRCSTALAAALLTALAAGEAAGQPGGLFREVAPAGAVAGPDLSGRFRFHHVAAAPRRHRLRAAHAVGGHRRRGSRGAAAAAPSGVLTLNLFDDASFTGLVQSVAPTFSGGYSLSGPLAGVEMGTMTLVVNGEVVAGTVRTPEATYRIRPAAGGLHAVSEVDLSRLPPSGNPFRGGRGEEGAAARRTRRRPASATALSIAPALAHTATAPAAAARATGPHRDGRPCASRPTTTEVGSARARAGWMR